MEKRLIGLTISLLVFTLIFWAIEFFWPSLPHQRRVRPSLRTDLIYWLFTPLVSQSLAKIAVLIALVPPMLLLGRKLDRATIAAGHGVVLDLPVWLQAVLIIALGDFIGYWTHRWHGRRLWAFHAVHHSVPEGFLGQMTHPFRTRRAP